MDAWVPLLPIVVLGVPLVMTFAAIAVAEMVDDRCSRKLFRRLEERARARRRNEALLRPLKAEDKAWLAAHGWLPAVRNVGGDR